MEKYRAIITRNTTRIEEIDKEIVPFKKIVQETNSTFRNVITKLDILETERILVKYSLRRLDLLYNQTKLPSRVSYITNKDNLIKRRSKIYRNIDKLIQQLRSYVF
jgi:hypothetical protein